MPKDKNENLTTYTERLGTIASVIAVILCLGGHIQKKA